MKIREFRDGDEIQIQKLHFESIRTLTKDYSKEQMDAWSPKDGNLERWRESLKSTISYVAEDKNEIVGFGDITSKGYLWRLYISPRYFGKNIGSEILILLEKKAKDIGLKEITLDSSIPARKFYEKHGYIMIKKYKKEVGKAILDVFFMKKILN